MSRGAWVVTVGLLGVLGVASTSAEPAATASSEPLTGQDSFPHLDHQGLFPLCEGCHEGISNDDLPTRFPDPASCAGCHDGVEEREVSWQPSAAEPGLIDFSHPDHRLEVDQEGEPAVACDACHVDEAGPRMAVVPLDAGRCLTCHEDAAAEHFVEDRDCTSCHRPLAEAPAERDRIAQLPQPEGHEADAFLGDHAPPTVEAESRCATCHVQQRCTSCHVDTGLPEIQRMPSAPSDWDLPPMAAGYPTPESHASPVFERTHGRPVPPAAECSTCHTRNDCAACHIEPLPASAAALPPRPHSGVGDDRGQEAPQEQEGGPGVGLESGLPASHDSPFFLAGHPTVASAAPGSCAGCHTESYCEACHDAPRAPGFHPIDFATRHSAAAGSMAAECSNCHDTEAFCRQCHVEVGFGSQGRLGSGYHDAEPLWLLRHGQGARQGLEQCVSCHTQRDCLQCHSQLGAFKVSPHGPDFDPERARSRNPWICSACHLGGAGGGR